MNSSIVNEAGASIYSASKEADKELPNLDVTVRGAGLLKMLLVYYFIDSCAFTWSLAILLYHLRCDLGCRDDGLGH